MRGTIGGGTLVVAPLRGGPSRIRQRIETVLARRWPSLLTAALLGLAVWMHALIHRFHRLTDFVTIGHAFAGPFRLDALANTPMGYDGQYYYFMARFPGQIPPGAFTWPALYYARMLYPLLARVLSLGQVGAIPWMMLAINFAAIVGTVAVSSSLMRRLGQPQWLALVPGLYCGQPMALVLDLTDPLFVFWLAVALAGVARRRWLLAGAALGLGMLTREATLAFVGSLALPLVLERRWKLLAQFFVVSLVPYVVWQVLVRVALGVWGVEQSSQSNALLPIPFAGLASAPNVATLVVLIALACIPAVAGILIGAKRLLKRPKDDALGVAAAAGAVVYGLLILVQPGVHWLDIWEPMRLAAPLALLLPLLVPIGRRGAVTKGVCVFMLASVLLALIV